MENLTTVVWLRCWCGGMYALILCASPRPPITMPKDIFYASYWLEHFALRFTICEWLCLAAFRCCSSFVYALYIKLRLLYVLFASVCLVHTGQCAGCRHLRRKYILKEVHIHCKYCIDMLVRLWYLHCNADRQRTERKRSTLHICTYV